METKRQELEARISNLRATEERAFQTGGYAALQDYCKANNERLAAERELAALDAADDDGLQARIAELRVMRGILADAYHCAVDDGDDVKAAAYRKGCIAAERELAAFDGTTAKRQELQARISELREKMTAHNEKGNAMLKREYAKAAHRRANSAIDKFYTDQSKLLCEGNALTIELGRLVGVYGDATRKWYYGFTPELEAALKAAANAGNTC